MRELDDAGAEQIASGAPEDLRERAVHAEEPPVERHQRHADRRVLERAAEPLLGLPQLALGAPPVGEVARADDDALHRRVVEQVGGDRLDHSPAAVGVAQPELGAVGALARACQVEAARGLLPVVGVDQLEHR